VDLDFRFDPNGEGRRFGDDFVEAFVKLYVAEIFRPSNSMRPSPYTPTSCRGTSCTCQDVVRTATLCFRHRDDRHGDHPARPCPGQLAPLLSSSFDDLINPADEVLDAHDEEQLADVRDEKAGARSLPRQPPPDCLVYG
jgi:hypothetical protein